MKKNRLANLLTQVRILFLVLPFFFSGKAGAQVCEDSVQLYSFKAPGLVTSEINTFQLNNGTRLNTLSCHTFHCSEYVIGLTDATGQPLRSRKIIPGQTLSIHISRFAEAPGGGAVGIGFVYEQDLSYQKGILLVRFNSNLDILWAKQLRPNFTGNTNLSFYTKALHCDAEGNVYCSFELLNGGFHPRNNFFVALSPAGELAWSQAAPEYFGPHFAFDINAAVTMEDKLYFLGAATADTTLQFRRVPRPGFTSFVFNRLTGQLTAGKVSFIPYTTEEGSMTSANNGQQVLLHPDKGRFRYGFLEAHTPTPAVQENNLVVFDLDASLVPANAVKLRGQISTSHQYLYGFNGAGNLAVVSARPSKGFAVLDSAYNLLASRAVGKGLFAGAQIASINVNDRFVSLGINNGNQASASMQLDFPLAGEIPQGDCLGTDTSFFQLEPVDLQTADVALPLVADVIEVSDIPLNTTPCELQKQEWCKVRSSCNEVRLSGPTRFCTNTVQTFRAGKNRDCWKNLVWQLEAPQMQVIERSDSSLTLRFLAPWSGKIKAVLNGCEVSDSLLVTVDAPLQALTLGPDLTLCPGEVARLSAPAGYKSYRWSTADTTASLLVHRQGTYTVEVQDFCGNVLKDTVNIRESSETLAVGKDTTICAGDTVVLNIDSRFQNYTWSPAALSFTGQQVQLAPRQSTVYRVEAEDRARCRWTQTFTIRVQPCKEAIWFPNAFTPGSDGKNDQYKPIVEGRLRTYQFSIYNRWGQVVFSSGDPRHGWDGYVKGKLSSQGVYVWRCRYSFRNGPPAWQKGAISLLY